MLQCSKIVSTSSCYRFYHILFYSIMSFRGGWKGRGGGGGNWRQRDQQFDDEYAEPDGRSYSGSSRVPRQPREPRTPRQPRNPRDPRPSRDSYDGPGGSSGNYPRRGGRPPGLKGKEIGLYYASLNKQKQHRELKKKTRIHLGEDRQQQIWRFLGQKDNNSFGQSSNSASSSSGFSHIADSEFKRRYLHNIEGNRLASLGPAKVIRTALERIPAQDDALKNEALKKQDLKSFLHMQCARMKLPSWKMKDEILRVLKDNQVVVISGETGCGKTTQVTQFILDDAIDRGEGSLCRVVCTQPRRISAISVACRVADERDENIGQSVGYQIRLESSMPRERGSILYCTTGILIQWLQSNPCLEKVSHLILDEIHERDILSDFMLTIIRDLLPHRPEMKLILMSATLNAHSFSKYYENCPMLNIPGMTFPVETHYLEDALQVTGFKFGEVKSKPGEVWKKYTARGKAEGKQNEEFTELMEPYVRKLKRDRQYDDHVLESLLNPESEKINLEFICSLLRYICNTKPDGAILIFLPGWDLISKLYNMITNSSFFSSARYLVLPLHSAMATTNQKEIFLRPPKGVRKIVIATNIAETSITIDDVIYVVDCGKIKMTNYDIERNLQTLKAEWVSLANAKQRRGRAGRVQPGVCYHLFSRRREMALESYQLPEMLRSRLESVILQMKILKLGHVNPFLAKVMDPPDPQTVTQSIKLLGTLNALDEDENLTPLGFHLAQLPMDPQTGKMILMGALFRCLDPILSIAASLSHKDAFSLPLGCEDKANAKKLELSHGSKSDHLVFAEAMRRWEQAERNGQGRDFCWEYFLSSNTLHMLKNMKGQLAEDLHQMNFVSSTDPKNEEFNVNSSNRSLVKAIVCAGLYPNLAIVKTVKINKKTGRFNIRLNTPEDGRVEIHPKSINARQSEFESPFMLYHLKLRSSSTFLHDTSMVHSFPLLFFGGRLKSVTDEDGESVLTMDCLEFLCNKDTAFLIKELRRRLDQLLEHKVTHPEVKDWSQSSPERDLMQAIVELITIEDKHHSHDQYSGDDSD